MEKKKDLLDELKKVNEYTDQKTIRELAERVMLLNWYDKKNKEIIKEYHKKIKFGYK